MSRPVRVLTGSNFDSVVRRSGRHVVVLFCMYSIVYDCLNILAYIYSLIKSHVSNRTMRNKIQYDIKVNMALKTALIGIVKKNVGGPVNFTICTLNIRSILHPVHSAAISDLIDSHHPDLFCLTETWIKPDTTPAELINYTPPSYSLLSFPRNSSANRHPPTTNLLRHFPALHNYLRQTFLSLIFIVLVPWLHIPSVIALFFVTLMNSIFCCHHSS